VRAAWGLVVATVILAGCGGTPAPKHAAARTPTPAETPTPVAVLTPPPTLSPSVPPRSASAATYARLATFNCRLPISNGQPGSGGFIAVPGGTFTSDPASNVAIDWTGAPPPKQQPGPMGAGRPPAYGVSFDRAVSKWLPVGAGWIALDGQSYAYPDFAGGGVRWVKIADGSVTTMGASNNWNVLDVEAEGAYAQLSNGAGPAGAGLWLLAPGKDPVQVVAGGYWQWVTTGFAYGFDAPSVPQGAPHPLLRLNLRDHTTETWYQNGASIQWIAGFDRGGAPIAVFQSASGYFGAPAETALIAHPDQKNTLLWSPQGAQAPAVEDSHGLWMVADQVYFNSVPVAPIQGELGGGCA